MSTSQATTEPSDQQQPNSTGPSESTAAPFSTMAVPNVAVMSPVANGPTPISNPNPANNMYMHPPQPVVDPKLLSSLRTQIEFYFSPSNLSRDHFLRSHFASYGGNVVPVIVICQFPKVQRICASFGYRAEPILLQLAVDKSPVVNVSHNAVWISPSVLPLPPMDPAVQSRVLAQKQNLMHPQPVMLNRSVSTGSNSGPYHGGVPIQQLKVNTGGSGNVTRTTSPASSQASASAVTNFTSGAVGEGGSSISISSLDKKSNPTIVILSDVPSDSSSERILNAFTFDDVVPTSARPDVGNTWCITFSSEPDAQRAMMLTKNGTIDGWHIKAQIKGDGSMSAHFKDSAAERSTTAQTSGTFSMDKPSFPNVVTPLHPNRSVPITHLPPSTQYHPYYRQLPQTMPVSHGGGGNYTPHYPQVYHMQQNGIPGAYPVPYGAAQFIPPPGVPRGYVINPNASGLPYRSEGGLPGPDGYRMTRKQSIGRKKKGHMNGIPRLDNLNHGGRSRSQGSRYDQDATQPNYQQESSKTGSHQNHFRAGRGYQARSTLSNNDISDTRDAYNGNSSERNYSKKKKGRKRDSFGGSNDAKERQGRVSKGDKMEAPELLDSSVFPALSGMESLKKGEGRNSSSTSNVGFSGYADALRQKKSEEVSSMHKYSSPTTSEDIVVESKNTRTIDLEEKIDALRISNLEYEVKSTHVPSVPQTIAVGALTVTTEHFEPAESMLNPKYVESTSIDNPSEDETMHHGRVEESYQTSNVPQDVISTKNSTPKAIDTDRTITPMSSNEASPDMNPPNSSWGSKRSFIDVSERIPANLLNVGFTFADFYVLTGCP